jgi:tetratricopeptide (TPR) repeat protein
MIYSLSREACQRLRQSLNIFLREDKINEMGHLILVYTISIISVIAFTYLTVTGVMGATTNTTGKVNATPNTTLHKYGVLRPSKDFLTPYYKGMAYLNEGNYTEAIPYFDKSLAINPNYTLALNNKGAALYGLGIYNESIAYFDKALSVNPGYTTALYNKGAALSKLGIYNESIAYFDKVLAIQPTNALALAGKKLDLATFSKTNIIANPTGTIATPQNPQSSDFAYYFQKRATASSYLTNTHTQKPILTCDQPGHPSCYSIGYAKGFLNTRADCSATTLNSFVLANASQVNNFCSGYRVAQQQALQQQHR